MKRFEVILLILIISLALFLRFVKLTENPVGLTLDETGIGYDAYSILKTGHDEYGQFMPLAFRSIDDYKPPVLIYLMVPSIAVFGLNEWGVRFPVAAISVLTVFVVYFLVKKLTKDIRIALFATFLMAISPWHIHFSRAAYEAVVALFFLIFGGWLFFKSLEEKGRFLWLSAISFILSMYSYHTERVFVPIFLIGIGFLCRQKLWQLKKQAITAILVGLIFAIPLIGIMVSPTMNIRAATAFITKDLFLMRQMHPSGSDVSFVTRVLDNNPLVISQYWAKRYLNYLDPTFLFFNGHLLTIKDSPQGMGLLYFFELPLLIIGLWRLLLKPSLARGVLIFWFLLAPLVPSLTIDEQHPLRTMVILPVPQIISAFGFFVIWEWLSRKRSLFKKLAVSVVGLLIIINVFYFLDFYWVHLPIQRSEDFADGFKEKTLYAIQNQDKYQEIVIDSVHGTTDNQIWGVPYLYFLFYGKYDPHTYQTETKRSGGNTQDLYGFGKYTFTHIDWPKETSPSGKLYIASVRNSIKEDNDKLKILKTIYLKNGLPAFRIIEAK